MSLTTTEQVLIAGNIVALPGSQAYIRNNDLRRFMEKTIKRWVKWPIEANDGMGAGNFLEYYDGKNYCDLTLLKPWVSRATDVRLNQLGGYGSNNQFANTTALTQGTDYSLTFEQTGLCRKGTLRRLGNNALLQGWWGPGGTIWQQGAGGMSFAKGPVWPQGNGNVRVTYDWGFQPATAPSAGTWAAGVATLTFPSAVVVRPTDEFTISGAVPASWNGDWQVATVSSDYTQITFRTPDDPGTLTQMGSATFIPLDIQAAVCMAVTIQRNQMQYGGRVSSEHLGDYSYNLDFNNDAAFGTVRQMLGPWRDVSQGIALV